MREQSFHSSTAPPLCLLWPWGVGISSCQVTAAVNHFTYNLQSVTQKEEWKDKELKHGINCCRLSFSPLYDIMSCKWQNIEDPSSSLDAFHSNQSKDPNSFYD